MIYQGSKNPGEESGVQTCYCGEPASHECLYFSPTGQFSLSEFYCETHTNEAVKSENPPRKVTAFPEWITFCNLRDQRGRKARKKAFEDSHVRFSVDFGE